MGNAAERQQGPTRQERKPDRVSPWTSTFFVNTLLNHIFGWLSRRRFFGTARLVCRSWAAVKPNWRKMRLSNHHFRFANPNYIHHLVVDGFRPLDLAEMKLVRQVTVLDFDCSDVKFFATTNLLPNITCLELYCDRDLRVPDVVAMFAELTNLQSLTCSGLEPSQVAFLLEIVSRHSCSLRSFKVSSFIVSGYTTGSVAMCQNLARLPDMETLELPTTTWSDDTLSYLKLARGQSATLRVTRTPDCSFAAFWRNNSSLQKLRLLHSTLTQSAVNRICRAISQDMSQRGPMLSLSFPTFGVQGEQALKSLAQLGARLTDIELQTKKEQLDQVIRGLAELANTPPRTRLAVEEPHLVSFHYFPGDSEQDYPAFLKKLRSMLL
jgi:hypothetical protein